MSEIIEERLDEISSHYKMEWSGHADIVEELIAEIRRLRAENAGVKAERDRAMAVGGVNWCLCGTDFVPDHKTYCSKCDQ